MSAGDGVGFAIDPTQVRKWKRYPAYKDSGVEWPGEVPAGWEIRPLKRLGHFQAGTGFPDEEQGLLEEELPFYKVSDMNLNTNEVYMTTHNNSISQKTANKLRAFVFPAQTVVFAKVGAALLLNRRRILTRDSCIDNNMMGFMCVDCLCKWAYYQMCNLDLGMLANPGAVPSVNEGQLRDVIVTVPTLEEQHAIVAFLDRETARIDALIQKKQRFIELLEEKCQAVISHAVTKGLDPDAEMKDSGVEWMGEVPAGWEVVKTKYVASLHSGHTPSRSHPEYWEDCTIPWFSLADVWQLREGRREYLGETKEKISQLGLANSAAELLPAGTVIVSRTASVGFSGIMPEPMATTQDFVNWVCDRTKILPEYLLYVFRSMKQEFERLRMGSTHKTIYMPDVAAFQTPLPPLDEQRRIVAYVQEKKAIFDQLEDKSIESVEKLGKYRTALISAAVTGKIDVRGETPAAP